MSAFAQYGALRLISIRGLKQDKALLVESESKHTIAVDPRLFQYGDYFRVLPDQVIVTDGIVISGSSEVDESMLTGESAPVAKSPGSNVIAGSKNISGALLVQLTRLPGESTIHAISSSVQAAKYSKSFVQNMADRVASYFVFAILFIALLVFMSWALIAVKKRHMSASESCFMAMTYAIATLIVSCPCAIVLAMPMVQLIATSRSARMGLILKGSQPLTAARKITHVVFDKTGTLTEGRLQVLSEVYGPEQQEQSKRIVLGLVKDSRHPVSSAIYNHLKTQGVVPVSMCCVRYVAGSGFEAKLHGSCIRAGNPFYLGIEEDPYIQECLATTSTIFCVIQDTRMIATYTLSDQIRPESISLINRLNSLGIKVSIVSGDNEGAVRFVASALNISPNHVHFRRNPKDKQNLVEIAQSVCKNAIVAFCGDGTNDAIALATADIGIHIPPTTTSSSACQSPQADLAADAADVILLHSNLNRILTLILISKAFHRRIVFNFVWCAVYNIFAILLAAGAFPGVRISPMFAGLGEIVSVAPVVLSGVSLLFVGIQ